MSSLMVARLARDEQFRGFHDPEVTGERGVGDAQVLGDLADADVALVLEVGEDLGVGYVCECRVGPIRSFGISGIAKYDSRVVFATNPDRNEFRSRRVGVRGFVESREATRRRPS